MPKKKVSEDVTDLNRLSVPMTPLRFALAKLTQEGYTRYPVGELLLLIKRLIREEKEES